MQAESELREHLAMAGRILFIEGHEHLLYGHVSARWANNILVKPAWIGIEEMTPTSPVVMSAEGVTVHGSGSLHTEMAVHTAILAARPEVNAIVHTHPRGSMLLSLFGAWDDSIAYTQDELPLLNSVGWYDDPDLVVTEEQGRRLARTLGARRAVVMANHGITTVGTTVVEAVVRAVLLERAARTRLRVLSLAGHGDLRARPILATTAESMAFAFERAQPGRDQAVWEYLIRRANAHPPGPITEPAAGR